MELAVTSSLNDLGLLHQVFEPRPPICEASALHLGNGTCTDQADRMLHVQSEGVEQKQ